MILIDLYDMVGWWSLVVGLQVVIITSYYLWSQKKSRRNRRVSDSDLLDWKPVPLVEDDVEVDEPPLMGKIDEDVLNVGATSFLCCDKEERIIESALQSMDKYGVGSCGPRGFYGTIDVHLELEDRLATFLEVEETIVYSYGFSTVASAIPSYAKKRDIIFADECVWFAIQQGLLASRSTIRYFKHNDMADLEAQLMEASRKKELNPRRRAFLVAEGIYFNTGAMCPLKQLVKLARQFKLRIILDESLSIGVVGSHGRGVTELQGVPRHEIDLMVGSLEHSFATVGGFCAGSHFMVEHQRLSGLGYCFSASLPPMLTQAAITALDLIEESPAIIKQLNDISAMVNTILSRLEHYTFRGDAISPIKHIYLKRSDLTDRLKETYLQNVTKYCMEKGVALTTAAYLRDEEVNCPEPSIRLAVSRKLNEENVGMICKLLDEAYERVGPKPDLVAV